LDRRDAAVVLASGHGVSPSGRLVLRLSGRLSPCLPGPTAATRDGGHGRTNNPNRPGSPGSGPGSAAPRGGGRGPGGGAWAGAKTADSLSGWAGVRTGTVGRGRENPDE